MKNVVDGLQKKTKTGHFRAFAWIKSLKLLQSSSVPISILVFAVDQSQLITKRLIHKIKDSQIPIVFILMSCLLVHFNENN